MQYHFKEIESKWQKYWSTNKTFRADNTSNQPKYYVLDMFPYPSGAGLHVGHPLGYIASDIVARYKRLKGFNVLHPMGYDSFGLPAEQYAIQTGQHPAVTTQVNIEGGIDRQGNRIEGYENQLKKLGLAYDWDREIRTSNPDYYRWTQWIFIQLFESYYDKTKDKACLISDLIKIFEKEGNSPVDAICDEDTPIFSAEEWNTFSEKQQQQILLKYRLTYLAEAEVNWCAQLGTVLANDEVVNGVSERGGYPVVRKKMTQWMMRITAYAERLLKDLDTIDWPNPIKDSQTYWIGKSKGASITFEIENSDKKIEVFTTRPDTIFGVSNLTLAPEHSLVLEIVGENQKEKVRNYIDATAKRSERERMAEVDKISGEFIGAYAIHPLTGKRIPIWIGDYVLAGYGTGAVMSVPAGDSRDYKFAKHFGIEIPSIFKGKDISEGAFEDKENFELENSDFLNGLSYKEATDKVISVLEEKGIGKGKINYRLRDAVFSRQRYWGEPVPAFYKDGVPYMLDAKHLPLVLPEVDEYLPTETGEPPLGRAKNWAWDTVNEKIVSNDLIDHQTIFPLELNTMPGWAGSSWYFLRYMDATNSDEFVSKDALNYWKEVDLYIGGSEHATGHLLYARFWQKFLYDREWVPTKEFAKKLINQGMILGMSAYVYRINGSNQFVSFNLKDQYETTPIFVDISLLKGETDELDLEKFKAWRDEYQEAEFILEDGKYICGREVEKMSKSRFNVVNPDDICDQYGADTLRLYEMFLGPLEQSKPWNTQGLSGVHTFLKRLWRLFHNGKNESFFLSDEEPTKEEMKILHQTIQKVDEDISEFSFNTSVSTFMIAVNELTKLKTNKRAILEPLIVLISPYAPHIAEELWERAGNKESISKAEFPEFDEKWLVEDTKVYPVSFNGKMRFTMELSLSLTVDEIEEIVMKDERTQKQLAGRTPKKVIIIPGKIINLVG